MMLTLAPMGGLANRMRSILSAYSLSNRLGCDLRVVWIRDGGLNAKFTDLFETVSQLHVEDIPRWKSIAFELPRKQNLFIPRLFQKGYEQCFFDDRLSYMKNSPGKLESMIEGKHVFIASGLGFYPSDSSLYHSLFIPRVEIKCRAEQLLAGLSAPVVGVHIRRTDNVQSIKRSPVELFISKMHTFNDSCFYLATDSEQMKQTLKNEFPGRVACSDREASRNTVEGMRDALCDMLVLSHTNYFLGSYYSSFSDIVLELNGKGEIVVN